MLNCCFQWNLNVPTKDVGFCQLEFDCPNKGCNNLSSLKWFQYRTFFFSWNLNVVTKDLRFCHFSVISILNCLFQVEFKRPNKGGKVLSSLKSFQYWTFFFSWNLNIPTNDVRLCYLWNHFNTELSFSVGIWMSSQMVQGSVIFEIIAIKLFLVQLELKCPNRLCMALSLLKALR